MEVFDEVAFSYFLLTLLGMILFPWTLYKVAQRLGFTFAEDTTLKRVDGGIGGLGSKSGFDKAGDGTGRKGPSRRSILFGVLWLIFLVILLRLPGSNKQLKVFDPFDILEIEPPADDRLIRRQFRKLSLRYHPDKNPDDAEAASKFILISKAYQTLTDPETKRNWELYGNPDGYQGQSVTIGLPEWLTDENNEYFVLLGYFLLVIILPPVLVYSWWSRVKDVAETGVSFITRQLYYSVRGEWSLQNIERYAAIYAGSIEFKGEMDKIDVPEKLALWGQLQNDINVALKQRGKSPINFGPQIPRFQLGRRGEAPIVTGQRLVHGGLLLCAHMLRVEVPVAFQPALNLMLEKSETLLPEMIMCNRVKRIDAKGTQQGSRLVEPSWKCMLGMVQFSQLLTQGLWKTDAEAQLAQLPHNASQAMRQASRGGKGFLRNLTNVDRALELLESEERKAAREKVFGSDFSRAQLDDIHKACKIIPRVEMDVQWQSRDGKRELYENDEVTLKVTLKRVEGRSRGQDEKASDDDSESNAAMHPLEKEMKNLVKKQKAAKAKLLQLERSVPKKSEVPEEKKEQIAAARDELDEIEAQLEELEDQISRTFDFGLKRDQKKNEGKKVAREALAPRVPNVKSEYWYLFIVDSRGKNAKVNSMRHRESIKKVELDTERRVDLKLFAPRNGKHTYTVYAVCDSYIGCDQKFEITFPVLQAKKREGHRTVFDIQKEKEEIKKRREEEEKEYEEENPELWYYLYYTSFGEMVLNVFVFGLLCVFIFNFLQSRGYWQRYVQPVMDFGYNVTDTYIYDLDPMFGNVQPEDMPEDNSEAADFDFDPASVDATEDAVGEGDVDEQEDGAETGPESTDKKEL